MLLMISSFWGIAFAEQYPTYINCNDIMIYNQWNNAWWEDDRAWYYWEDKNAVSKVYCYGKNQPVGMTLAGGGCGLFALTHIAQYLGLEPTGNPELPYEFAKEYKYTYVSGLGENSGYECYHRFANNYGLKYTSNGKLKDVLKNGGADILSKNKHLVAAVDISEDESKVRIIDSCSEMIQKSGVTCYIYNKESNVFSRIMDWSTVAGKIDAFYNAKIDVVNKCYPVIVEAYPGKTWGAAEYWIDYSEAEKWGHNYFYTTKNTVYYKDIWYKLSVNTGLENDRSIEIKGTLINSAEEMSSSPEIACFVSKFEKDISDATIADPGYTYFINCSSSFFDEPSEEYSFAFSTNQFKNIYNESPELLPDTTYYYKWVAIIGEEEIASKVMSFTMPYEANWNLHDVTDLTPIRATLNARFNIPLNSSYPQIGSYKTVGCFLSKNLDDITKATPTNYNTGTVHMVSENLGSSTEGFNNGSNQYIGVSYTTEGEPSSGLGFGIKALDENDTYYYKFFGTVINDDTVYYSPAIQTFNTPDGGSISITTIASAGGDIAVDRTGKYDPGEEISLEAIPWVGGTFIKWSSSNGGTFSDSQATKTTFIVPDQDTTITAYFTYTPIYSLSLIPDSIDMGTLYCGYHRASAMEASRVLTLKNTGNQTLTLDTTTKLPSFRFENYSKTELKPGEEATVTIIPEMNLEPRVHDFSLYVSASGNNGTVWAGAELDLKLTVKDNPALQKAVQCPHCLGTNTRIDNGIYDPYYELYEGKWTDNGDGTHTGMAVLVNWMYCEDCDNPLKRFSVPIAEPAMYTGKHVYLEGACNVCGKVVKECPHEMYTLLLVDEELIIYTPRYRDEQFHFQPRTETLYYECAECNELYSETWEAEFIYAHSYDANGLCDCGATGKPTTCEHSPMELREDEVNIRYKEIGESTHTRISDVYMDLWCPHCETSREYNLWYTTRNTETHSYVAGKCVCGKNEPFDLTISYLLPNNTQIIANEAFSGTPVQQVIVNDGCQVIGSGAFAHCTDLVRIVLPESVLEIAEDAFLDCNSLTIIGHDGSYAMEYAKRQGIPFSILN